MSGHGGPEGQPSEDLRLDGQTVVVTGASAGLGEAYARALAQQGAALVLTGRRRAPLEALIRELPHAVAVVGDVGAPGFADELVSRALAAFGRIDAVVNNAGGVRDRTLLKMTDAEFDEVIKAHVYGTFYVTRACAVVMRDQRSGTIINVGSDSGLHGAFGQTNYAAAKGAVLGMTLTWAKELVRYGVTCNCVLPNALTAMTEGLPELLSAYRFGPPGAFPRAIGQASEAAPLVVLLATTRWRWLNAAVLSLGGDRLSVWQPPTESRTAFLQGGWSVAELDRSMEFALGNPFDRPDGQRR
jgi:NAD(P)-dependent dehydrogenase (short-subunit alcohol dehydrogenase family)